MGCRSALESVCRPAALITATFFSVCFGVELPPPLVASQVARKAVTATASTAPMRRSRFRARIRARASGSGRDDASAGAASGVPGEVADRRPRLLDLLSGIRRR
jgi:hypothetical protein